MPIGKKKGANPNEQAKIRLYTDKGVSAERISDILRIELKVVKSFVDAHEGGSKPSKAPTAAELIEIIKVSEDNEFLSKAAEDSRSTVASAAEARLVELEGGGGGL